MKENKLIQFADFGSKLIPFKKFSNSHKLQMRKSKIILNYVNTHSDYEYSINKD